MDQALFISTRDLEVGVARRDCPNCGGPVLIRLPSMNAAIADRETAAVRLGLHHLTRTERRLFDAIYDHFPRAVTRAMVREVVDAMAARTLDTNLARMRPKLAMAGWRLVGEQGTLRLVADP